MGGSAYASMMHNIMRVAYSLLMIKRVNQFSKTGVANFSFWSPRAMHREGALVGVKPHDSSQLA